MPRRGMQTRRWAQRRWRMLFMPVDTKEWYDNFVDAWFKKQDSVAKVLLFNPEAKAHNQE